MGHGKDGQRIIDDDGIHGPTSVSGSVYLNQGQHQIEVDYFQGPRYYIALQLFWTPPGGSEVISKPPIVPPSEPQTPTSISSPQGNCVWNIYGMSLQLGAIHAYASADDRYNLQRGLTYAIDNCKACCCHPEPLQDLLNRLNSGESSQSLLTNGIVPLEENRERLGLQDCVCSRGNSVDNGNNIWYIYGMALQLGAAHGYAYANDRADLQTALEYSLENCQASSCCLSAPLQDLLNRLNTGESTQSLFQNGIIPLEDNRERLGLQDCTCCKIGGVCTGSSQTGTSTVPGQPVSLNPPGQGCREGVTSLYADYRALNPGQEVVIPIIMCNAHDVANMDLSVTYDSSVLKFKSAVKGSLNANTLFESNNIGNTVKIAFAGKSGFSGTGSIAVLTFTIIGQKGSSSPITIQVNEASTTSGAPVDVSVQNGQVSVGNNNPNNPGGNPDGRPTSLDALKALQMSVGKLAVDLNYDLTKDGKVTSGDAREILKLVVQ